MSCFTCINGIPEDTVQIVKNEITVIAIPVIILDCEMLICSKCGNKRVPKEFVDTIHDRIKKHFPLLYK